MNVKLMTEHHLEFLSLKGGCTGLSESTLVKIPHCLKAHATAQIYYLTYCYDRDLTNDIICVDVGVERGWGGAHCCCFFL